MLGAAVNAILVLVIVEAMLLVDVHARTRRGIAPSRLLGNLLAGFLLLLAVRFSLAGVERGVWICLLLALFAHVFDLAMRWRS